MTADSSGKIPKLGHLNPHRAEDPNAIMQIRWPVTGELRSILGTRVCRYNWHSAGSLGWPFPMPNYKYIFQIKYTEAILGGAN